MRLTIVTCLLLLMPQANGQKDGVYSERYRPQFHFSPRSGWIGDPNGLFSHRGIYHLFWWGHAESADLVHWRELPYPMTGDDGSFKYFSGSVVMDYQNSSGLGDGKNPPMVAVYTAHGADRADDQRLSSSTDHRTFRYFKGSPVLPAHPSGERDPGIFWHKPSRRWVMTTVIPEQHQIRFHTSEDLKSWTYQSTFGPLGATSENWELPDLFELPCEGPKGGTKWVMLCGVGPNKVQQFNGDFDGSRFVPDDETLSFMTRGADPDGSIFADFEAKAPREWAGETEAYQSGTAPAGVAGFFGEGVLASKPGRTGRILSAPFAIHENCLNFLLGGSGRAGVNLLIDGKIECSSSVPNTPKLRWTGWNVSRWAGREARIEVFNDDPHGGVVLDQPTFSSTLMNTGREHARWLDWGSDFYAARAIRNPEGDGRIDGLMAWMGNWKYANQVPTSWGRGTLSIPRTLRLAPAADGHRICQSPFPALAALRGPAVEEASIEIRGNIPLPSFKPAANHYEFEAEFRFARGGMPFGFELCAGNSDKVVLGFDPITSNVFLDRRKSGDVGFSPDFPQIDTAPLRAGPELLKLHVFVDQSTIEVFVNDGEAVMSSLIFPSPDARGIRLFADGKGCRLQRFKGWNLESIWKDPQVGPVQDGN